MDYNFSLEQLYTLTDHRLCFRRIKRNLKKRMGIRVKGSFFLPKDISGQAIGYDLIRIKARLGNREKLHTLIHELCHIIGRIGYDNYRRSTAEVIVESAAMGVANRIGLGTRDSSKKYIEYWKGDKNYINIRFQDEISKQIENKVFEYLLSLL